MSEDKRNAEPASTTAMQRMLDEIRQMSSATYTPRSSHFKNDYAHSGALDRQPRDGGQKRRLATARYHARRRAALKGAST